MHAQPAGKLIGSPGYAAPDLEAGAPISAAMDVYGLGVTLYEALTGNARVRPRTRRPATGRAPPPLPDRNLAALVAAMLDADPLRRPDARHERCGARRDHRAARQPAWPPGRS